MVGKRQIEYLKLLGYEDTQEDGALLQHPGGVGDWCSYAWKDETFADALVRYNKMIKDGVLLQVHQQIRKI